MIGFGGQRDADRFDALVAREGGRPALDDAEMDRLLDLVGALRDLPDPPERLGFAADLRTRLVAEAERRAAPTLDDDTVRLLTPKQRRGARERRLATVVGGFAVVAATGSMAMASQAALPGDVLYPVKRAIENAQTNLRTDDAGKAETLLAHAEQRLDEVAALSRRDQPDSDEIAGTLQDFAEQTNQASILAHDEYESSGDERPLSDLRSFSDRAMLRLDSLSDAVPDDARPALITAAQTVRQVDDAALQTCPTCGEGDVADLPEFATQSLERLLRAAEAAEDAADQQSAPSRGGKKSSDVERQPKNSDGGDETGSDSADDTTDSTEPEVDPTAPEDVDDPIRDITEEVEKGLGLDPDDDKQTVTEDVVEDVDDIVDGLLG